MNESKQVADCGPAPEPGADRRVWRWLPDAVALTLLLSLGTLGGHEYVERLVAAGNKPEFYQTEFGPAVLAACGRGFHNVDEGSVPVLQDFLRSRVDHLDCATLPSSLPSTAFTGRQATWKYLLRASAMTWWITGSVSWTSLQWLSGVFLAATGGSMYLGVRLFAGPLLSLIAAGLVMTSPIHLRQLLHVRDYAKAPFMIAAGVILALLVTRRLSFWALMTWAAAFGLVLGIGMGFRNDLLIALPAFVVVAVFAGLRGERGTRAKRVAGALGCGLAAFVVAAAPVSGAYAVGGGASMSHVALLGFAPSFDAALGVERSPLYGFSHSYDDSYVAAVVSDVASRSQHDNDPIRLYGASYDRASNAIVGSVFRTLPADVWLRGLASMLKVMQLPSVTFEDTEPPPALPEGVVARAYLARARVLRGGQAAILLVVVLAFLAGAAVAPAPASVLLILTAYFAGYPAVQFHARHYFHMNVVAVAAAAYLVSACWRSVRAVIPRPPQMTMATAGRVVRNLVVIVLVGMVVLVMPLPMLRAYQDVQVSRLLEDYATAPRETVVPIERSLDAGRVALEFTDLPASLRTREYPQTVQTEYLAVEIATATCDLVEVALSLDYDTVDTPPGVFDRVLRIRLPFDADGTTLILAPVYFYRFPSQVTGHDGGYAFRGLSLPAGARQCVSRVSRVLDASRFPLLIDVVMLPNWGQQVSHQTLAGWEPTHDGDQLLATASSANMLVHRSDVFAPLALLPPEVVNLRSDTVSALGSGHISVNGNAAKDGPSGYLVRYDTGSFTGGQRLVAQGVLKKGGLTIGLVSQGQWVASASITSPGPFIAVVDAPAHTSDGAVVIANDLRGWSLHNEFDITRMGWQR